MKMTEKEHQDISTKVMLLSNKAVSVSVVVINKLCTYCIAAKALLTHLQSVKIDVPKLNFMDVHVCFVRLYSL